MDMIIAIVSISLMISLLGLILPTASKPHHR